MLSSRIFESAIMRQSYQVATAWLHPARHRGENRVGSLPDATKFVVVMA